MAIPQTPTKDDGATIVIKCAANLGSNKVLPEKKACHQCRQMTENLGAPCGRGRSGRVCPIRYCSKCLLNRYGEKTGKDDTAEGWSCPKCRGLCNCSRCMKKRGQPPTGALAPTAKATGFVSVLDMLRRKAVSTDKVQVGKNDAEKTNEKTEENGSSLPARAESEEITLETSTGPSATGNSNQTNGPGINMPADAALEPGRDTGKVTEILISGKKRPLPDGGESNANVDGFRCEGNAGADDGTESHIKAGLAFPNIKNPRKKRVTTGYVDEPASPYSAAGLPPGTCLTTIAGLELTAEDVGPALQFLEFCAAFGKVLDVSKGQPESILRELFRSRAARLTANSLAAQFHSKILFITRQNRTGNNRSAPCSRGKSGTSWLQDIQQFVTSYFNKSIRYDELDSSKRLRLLNFLCDEALSSECMRNCIEEENTKFIETKKEVKRNIRIAREKEINQNQTAEIEQESDPIPVSKMADKLDSAPEKKQRSDAVRTSCIAIDVTGRTFWKLKGHCGGLRIIFQDIKEWNVVTDQDKWFCYDDEEEKIIEKHVSSQRNRRLVRHRVIMRRALQDITNASADSVSELIAI